MNLSSTDPHLLAITEYYGDKRAARSANHPNAPIRASQTNLDAYLGALKQPGDEVMMPITPGMRGNHVRHWCEVRCITIKTTTKGIAPGMLRVICVRHVAYENEQRAIARRALEAFDSTVARQACAV